jgi:hypothetical protein
VWSSVIGDISPPTPSTIIISAVLENSRWRQAATASWKSRVSPCRAAAMGGDSGAA